MGGGEVTCPGGQGVFDPYWGRLIKALTCPGGRGGSDSMCVLGVGGSEKKMCPPLRIISGTALNLKTSISQNQKFTHGLKSLGQKY